MFAGVHVMRSPRKRNRFTFIIIAFLAACVVTITAFSERVVSIAALAEIPKDLSAETFNVLQRMDTNTSPKGQSLLPVSGKLVFEVGGYSIRGIDNVGSTNDLTEITSNRDGEPVFSGDGKKILFRSSRDSDNAFNETELYVMDPDGFNQRRLTFNSEREDEYSFSLDGSKITFSTYGRIWVMNADGTGLIEIADPNTNDLSEPALSPDGSLLTYVRDGYVWKADSDGSNAVQMSSQNGSNPRFSPDGQHIFWTYDATVSRINVDGTNETLMIDGSVNGYSYFRRFAFSPAGDRLAFLCEGQSGPGVCVANSDGTGGLNNFGSLVVSYVDPVWSPNGEKVAFLQYDSSYKIIVANADGTGETEIYATQDPDSIAYLSWQPSCTETAGNTNGLVSWWRGELNANDSFGSNNGIFEPPTYATGRIGNGFFTTENGHFVEVPDSASLDVQTGDYTVAAWAVVFDSREHFIVGKGACGASGSNFYIGIDDTNKPFLDISHESGGSRYSVAGTEVGLAQWNHFVLKKEGTSHTLYKNAQPIINFDEPNTILSNDAPFTIGRGDSCDPPQLTSYGIFDEVYLYNRALSQAEITANYSLNSGPTSCPPPVDPAIALRIAYPNPVAQGRQGTAELRLGAAAPQGGTTISLQSSDPAKLAVPTDVFVPEGSVNTYFQFTTSVQSDPTVFTSADIIAGNGTDSARATVSIAPAAPDVAGSNIIAPATVNILEGFSASWTVTNVGQAATGSYRQDTVFLSADNILFNDPSDVFIGHHYDNSGTLAPGQSKVFNASNIVVPSAAAPVDGTYYLFVHVGPNINERNGNFQNNYTSVPIQVNRNLPDLIAENIVVPAEIEPGVQFTISWDVRNAGSAGTINAHQSNVYLSFDDVVGNADDVLVTQRVSPAFAAGESQSFAQNYVVPTVPSRPSSNALVYVRVNFGGTVFEDNPGGPAETNNTTSTPARFEYRVPDLQVTSALTLAEVDSDTAFAIVWTTTNAGLRSADAMNERVYFSTDNQVGGDTLLGTFVYNSPIAAGSSIVRIQNVTIPTNAITSTGDYFVYVQTDAFSQVNEGENEANNTRFAPLRVRRLLRPDLEVTNITAPSTAFFDQEIQVQWTVGNNGTGPTNSPNWTDELFLNINPTLSGATRLVVTSNISFLEAGESYIASATVRIPRGSTGSQYLVVRTDVNNTVNEEVETNNLSSRPITLNVPLLPDLRVSNVQAPDEGFGGSQILVSWTVTNHGDGAVPSAESTWSDTIILSRDAILDGSDRVIGTRPRIGAIAAGAAYSVNNFSVNLPLDAVGEYYVFVQTDAFSQVYEFTNENNNSDHDRTEPGSPLNVLGTPPDLTISTAVAAPPSIVAGQSLTASFTVRNQGAFDAVGSWRELLYLSADQSLDPVNDIFLGSSIRSNLSAGQSYGAAINATIPTCLNGTYYLFAVTDGYNNIFEFDPNGSGETNNISAPKAIDISNLAPDLRVTNIAVPPVVINGAMPITWTVKNFGTAAATQNSWADRVFLINNGQVYTLGTFQRQGGLAVDAEYIQNQVVNIPLFLQGQVTIYVEADYYNVVPECSFETNNQNSALTDLQSELPDLRVNTVNAPGAAALGTSITVDWTGQNFGTPVNAASWADRVYLSSDQSFGFGDIDLGGNIYNQPLATNQTWAGQAMVTVPNVAVGNYYLLVVADAGSNISEGINESNNVLSVPITLTTPPVDLQVTNISAGPVIYSGQYADISWTVNNNGTQATASAAWSDWVVLSRDAIYDQSDTVLEFRRHSGSLGPGANYTENRQIAMPPGLTGDYKILIITDRHNEVVESNNANNQSSTNVVLQLPPPAEFNITGIVPPATVILGETSVIEWTVQNSSSNPASGIWQDSVYLSADQVWDSSDHLVGTRSRSGTVGGFATYTETMTTVVPPVDPGVYYLIVRTDSRNSVRESNEANNVATSAAQTTVTLQNLTLGMPVNMSLVTGQERFFSILNTPLNETMLITLDGQPGSSNELFTRFGSIVSRANYQFQGDRPGEPDQLNVVPSTNEGTYFTMIRGDLVPGSFKEQLSMRGGKTDAENSGGAAQNVTLRAELLPFSIRTVTPSTAGNKGLASLQIDGAKFDQNAAVKLVGAGGVEITPVQMAAETSRIAAIFDLTNRPIGTYDVVVTNPNAATTTLVSGFQIVPNGGYQLRTSIVPPTPTRGGVTKRIVFTAHNDGLNDALNVPIFIQFPAGYNYSIDQLNFLEFPESELPPDAIPGQIPLHVDQGGFRTLMLYAPLVRSRSSIEIKIDLAIPVNYGQFPASIQVLRPLGELAPYLGPNGSPALRGLVLSSSYLDGGNQVNAECWAELMRQIFFAVLGELLPSDCLKAGWTVLAGSVDVVSGLLLKNAAGSQASGWDLVSSLAGKFVSTTGKLAECAGKTIPWLRAISLALTLVQLLSQLDDCLLNGNYKQVVIFRQPVSLDPNEKLGPEGFGPERFVGIQRPIEYRINFENLAAAQAPAQVVRIVDQLPPTLDPRTLRLREIGFKQYRVEVPENRAFYQTRLQLGEDLGNIQAEISAGLNIQNGTVTWTMTAIDPQTNERPLSPLVGLLPPNNANRDGEGYVTFTIEPKTGQTTGTDIANSATIYFDENEPIVTNTTTNMLDADIPDSTVAVLPATFDQPTFNISWSGSDAVGGSGLKRIDVYVSENGGQFAPLTGSEGAGTAVFAGKWGRSYRFFSLATDNAGNVEAAPSIHDAETAVLGGAFEADVAPRPNGNNDGSVSVADLTQIRRFVAELDTDLQFNEFQRVDTAPITEKGDGALSVADIIQARRYAAGLDAVSDAAGPNQAITPVAVKTIRGAEIGGGQREIRPVRVSRVANKVTIGVEIDAQGDEVAVGFTLNFNPAVIGNPANISLGSGAAGMSLTVNTSQAAAGRIGIVMDKDPTQPLPAGVRQLVTIEFDVAAANPATAMLAFGNAPVRREVVNGLAQTLTAAFTDTEISLVAPTSATVGIAGRVVNSSGNGIPNTVVTITDAGGESRRVLTNGFGNYYFNNITVGQTYIVTASHKRFQFEPPNYLVTVSNDLVDVDFRALE